MDWKNASNYCQKHCKSELVSIHSHQQYQDIIKLINNQYINYLVGNKQIWIGLYRNLNIDNNNMTFQWADNSTLDFGNITNDQNIGKYPWDNGDPDPISDGQHCVALEMRDTNWFWNDKQCTENNHILCNQCDGIITKYVVYTEYLLHDEAQNICKETYVTQLASIHTDNDQEFAKLLCEESGSNDCWIGLFDEALDRNYSWDDGTTFDFGYKVDGNPPWEQGEPDAASNNHQCGKLNDDDIDYLWADSDCNVNDHRKFICNMPSEICYQHQWHLIEGRNMDWKWMLNSCDVVMDSVSGIIMNKQWNNYDMLVIEYMFTIYNVTSNGYGGIAIYNGDCNHYHYIALYPMENVLRFEYVESNINNGVDIGTKSLNFTYESGIFYLLRIERLNGNIYNIYINGVKQAIFEDNIASFFVNTSLSGYIGVKNHNCSIIAKSLFVSGEVVYNNNTSWYDSCTLYPTYSPTMDPTTNPTINPTNSSTINPTVYPTDNPTIDEEIEIINYGVYITISFEYNMINTSISTHYINDILSNIVSSKIMNQESDCIVSQQYNTSIINITKSVIINATIFVCDSNIQSELVAFVKNELVTDLVDKTNDEGLLIVDEQTVKVLVETIENKIQMTTTDNVVIETLDDAENKENSEQIMMIFAIVGGVILCIVILFCIVIWNRTKNKKFMQSDDVTSKRMGITITKLPMTPSSGIGTNKLSEAYNDIYSDTSIGNRNDNSTENNGDEVIGDVEGDENGTKHEIQSNDDIVTDAGPATPGEDSDNRYIGDDEFVVGEETQK